MNNREKTWLWVSAAVLFVVGFILILSDSGAGWFLIILGITYIGVSTRAGQSLAESHPRSVRWGVLSVTLLFILLAVILSVVLLLK